MATTQPQQPRGPFDLSQTEFWTRVGAVIVAEAGSLALLFVLAIVEARHEGGLLPTQVAVYAVAFLLFFAACVGRWSGPVRTVRTRFTVEGISQPRLLGLRGQTSIAWREATPGTGAVIRAGRRRIRLELEMFADPVWAAQEIVARAGKDLAGCHTLPLTPPHAPGRLRFARRWLQVASRALPTLLTAYTEEAIHQARWLGFAGETVLRWVDVTEVVIAQTDSAPPVVTLRAHGQRVTLRMAAFEDPDAVLGAIQMRLPRGLTVSIGGRGQNGPVHS